MRNHKDMTAKEAVRAAKEESGLTTEQIARRLNVSTAVIKRYLKEDDAYFPRLDILPRLCLALGNTLLLDWAAAQLGQEFGGDAFLHTENGDAHLPGGGRNPCGAG